MSGRQSGWVQVKVPTNSYQFYFSPHIYGKMMLRSVTSHTMRIVVRSWKTGSPTPFRMNRCANYTSFGQSLGYSPVHPLEMSGIDAQPALSSDRVWSTDGTSRKITRAIFRHV
ncbi:hypothetical protein TNCV_2910491 [Trichonephila clavipes]|nr:hypothetical protein TNCV_2910491 [Trichonephila clavipes]